MMPVRIKVEFTVKDIEDYKLLGEWLSKIPLHYCIQDYQLYEDLHIVRKEI